MKSMIRTDNQDIQTRSGSSAEILVRNLHRTYQVGGTDVLALQGVDLQIDAGQFVGIVGVSGSGKSTLLHLVGGLDTPDDGEIVVAGHVLRNLTAYQKSLYRRNTIGFIFQSFYLVPNLTAEQNIRLTLTLQGIYGKDRTKMAAQAVERVGLSHRANHKPGQLSGGEQQRITVARAIVNKPRLLLADEPTGNLDQATAMSLMALIDGIRKDTGMTILMVTHNESLANSYCDRIVRMRDGKFV
jgi:ABC-type lipoprotein export system ATPase subunit